MKKQYTIIAGVNGAGKSTIFNSPELSHLQGIHYINPDELLRNSGDDWNNLSAQVINGKKAVKLINEYFRNGISFSQETTLTGHLALKNIRKANALGYEVIMYYIGLESVDLAVMRVEKRVREGGHGINEADIRRRFGSSLKNLIHVIPYCDKLYIYDNTEYLRLVAYYDKLTKRVTRYDDMKRAMWLENILTIKESAP